MQTVAPIAILLALVSGVHIAAAKTDQPPVPGGSFAAAPASELDAAVERGRRLYLAGDHAGALALVRPAAEAGHPMAQNILGDAYDTGQGVPQDYALARQWWEGGNAAGSPRAAMNLGTMLRDGRPGMAPDLDAARAAFAAAVERGYGPAYAALGRAMERGEGGPVDVDAALDHYRRGQRANDPWAYEYEAHLHLNGFRVARDQARARVLFEAAADLGLAQSASNLGVMLREGLGGEVDLPRAEQLFEEAVGSGYVRAGFNLAQLLAFHADPPRLAEAVSACDQAMEADPELGRQGFLSDCMDIAKQARATGALR